MTPKGQKRKLAPEEAEPPASGWSAPAWESQRQFVFTVSLLKYQHGQELAEPSLRRSVLIANTLRQVSLGGGAEPPSVGAELPQPPPSFTFDLRDEEPCGRGHPSEVMAGGGGAASCWTPAEEDEEDEEDDWGSMSTDPDFEVETAIASILCSLDSTMDGGPPAAARAPLRAVENLAAAPEGGASWEKQGGDGGGGWEQQQAGGVEVLRSSYLSDVTVEDLFQDIDTSLVDADVEVLGVRSGGGGEELLRYLPPLGSSPSSSDSFSIALNPSLKCLPAFSSFIPSSSSSFELEHLMEVLVES